jgi:hypothetical protein
LPIPVAVTHQTSVAHFGLRLAVLGHAASGEIDLENVTGAPGEGWTI